MDNENNEVEYIKSAYKIKITHMCGYDYFDEIHYGPGNIICEMFVQNGTSLSIYDKGESATITLSISGINDGIHCIAQIATDNSNENIDTVEFDVKFTERFLYIYPNKHIPQAIEFRLLLEVEDVEEFFVEIEDSDAVGDPVGHMYYLPDFDKRNSFSCKAGKVEFYYEKKWSNYTADTINENAKQLMKNRFVNMFNDMCYNEKEDKTLYWDYYTVVLLKNGKYVRKNYSLLIGPSWDDYIKEQVEFIERHFKNPIDLKGHSVVYNKYGYAFDAAEETQEYLAVVRDVEKKAKEMDTLHTFESFRKVKQQLLKELGIDWLTPEECNPPEIS